MIVSAREGYEPSLDPDLPTPSDVVDQPEDSQRPVDPERRRELVRRVAELQRTAH